MSNACFLFEAHWTVGVVDAWFGFQSLFLNDWSSCRLIAVSLSTPAPRSELQMSGRARHEKSTLNNWLYTQSLANFLTWWLTLNFSTWTRSNGKGKHRIFRLVWNSLPFQWNSSEEGISIETNPSKVRRGVEGTSTGTGWTAPFQQRANGLLSKDKKRLAQWINNQRH